MKTDPALTVESQRIFFTAMAQDEGITVKWDRNCKTPHASKTGVVTLPPPNVVRAKEWLYNGHHEVSHRFRENLWHYKVLDLVQNQIEAHCANVFSDHLVDKSKLGVYEGRDKIMDEGRADFLTEDIYPNFKHIDDKKHPWEALCAALFIWDTDTRALWKNSPNMLALDLFTEKDRAFYEDYTDILHEMNLEAKLLICRDEHQLYALVLEVLDLIHQMHQKKQQGKGGGSGKGEGQGEKGNAPGMPSGSGKGDEKGKSPETSKGDEEGAEAPAHGDGVSEGIDRRDDIGAQDEALSHYEGDGACTIPDFLIDVYKPMDRDVEETEHTPYNNDGAEAYVPYAEHDKINVIKGDPGAHAVEQMHDLVKTSTLNKKIKKNLLIMMANRYQFGLRKGRLHYKNMHRAVTQDKPSMYKEKANSLLQLDTAFSLVVDCSGSMSGTKYLYAGACATSVAEVLDQLGIKHEIIGFTERRKLVSYFFKSFGEKLSTFDLCRKFGNHDQIYMGANADGESVMFCAERLLKRKEKNKIMIVFSDGYPAGAFCGDGHAYLKKVCEILENKTPIDLIGLGMHSNAVEKFYKNNAVITDITELNKVVMDALKRGIIR